MHQLVGCACASGVVKFYDPRASSIKELTTLNVGGDEQDRRRLRPFSSLNPGLRCAVGTETWVTSDVRHAIYMIPNRQGDINTRCLFTR